MQKIPDSMRKKLIGTSTLNWHRAHPDIPLDIWSRVLRQRASATALARKRIYLDQKYWNYCRDVIVGRPTKREHTQIWEMLCDLSDGGKIVCPIGQPVFRETLKLERGSRMVVARAIDRLCHGVAIQAPRELAVIEISHWTWKHLLHDDTLPSASHFAFTPAAFVFGDPPIDLPFPGSDALAMKKAILDFNASFSLEDLMQLADWPRLDDDDSAFQAQQTLDAKLHQSDFSSYKEVYALELRGIADLFEADLQEFVHDLWNRGMRVNVCGLPCSPEDMTREVVAIIVAGMLLGRVTTEIPTLHIRAAIHAAIRWRRQQKYVKGDRLDFQHATVALGYCDAFLTDRRLENILRLKPPDLARQYHCEVISDDARVLDYLHRLSDGREAATQPGNRDGE
jgi:hypothetical protein